MTTIPHPMEMEIEYGEARETTKEEANLLRQSNME